MKKKFTLTCSKCSNVLSESYSPFCPSCGGLTEAYFDLDTVKLHDSDNPYERYFDLIPVIDRERMPYNAVATPLVHAKRLGEKIGLENLYLKDETRNPTGTTKYRMAAVSLPYLYESGVRHFCTSSTGNSSTAYANLIEHTPGLKMSLFTGDKFRDRVNYTPSGQISHYIMHTATFVEAFDEAAHFAARHGYTSERGFFNLGRREGLKLAWFEAIDQIGRDIDWYVQAVSSAMGVYGVYKGAKEFQKMGVSGSVPKLLCAQQDSCCPMVTAWEAGSEVIRREDIVANPDGLAKAILRGDPSRVYPYMWGIVLESGGTFSSVSAWEQQEARKLLLELEGIDICFSAATAVAAVIKSARTKQVAADETIMVNLTGSDRPYGNVPDDVIHLFRGEEGWEPSRVEASLAL